MRQVIKLVTKGIFSYLSPKKWRTQRDSNLQSPASEADALSSCAMGALPGVLYDCMIKMQVAYPRCNNANIKSSKSPSKTAVESVFSTPVRTSLTNWYGYRT